MNECLEVVANVVAILTGGSAAYFYLEYRCRKCRQCYALEEYLKKDKERFQATPVPNRSGKRSVVHLMAKLKFTEDEIYQAAFSSNHIACTVFVDKETRRAADVNFEYVENAANETMVVHEEESPQKSNPN